MSTIIGTVTDDALIGSQEADIFTGVEGNDTLDGGAGNDTALYAGNASDYRLGWSNGYLTVTDLNAADSDEGTDYLRGIESLQFADRTLSITLGSETRINSSTPGNQSAPAVTALADGGWWMTWTSFDPASYDADIHGQRYDASGSAVGGEVCINSATAYSSQSASAVTALADGGWLVAWQADDRIFNNLAIYTQRYDASGGAVGGETRINSFMPFDQSAPAVTALADGGWLVTWQSAYQAGSGSAIYAQRYDASGSAVGGETPISNIAQGDQWSSAVTALADGGWLVTWQALDPVVGDWDIYARRYAADGSSVGGETRVNSTVANTQLAPAVTTLADGGWLVTWQSYAQDADGFGIYAQRYAAGGNAVGGEIRINSTTVHGQSAPAVTTLADGGWLVTWESEYQDGSGTGIYAQRYDAAGSTVGSEIRINSNTENNQLAPTVTALADGGWLVAWQSDAAVGTVIAVQRYNADGSPVRPEVQGTSASDSLNGAGLVTLAGGVGNDSYMVSDNQVQIREGFNEGVDGVQASSSYTLGANLENLVLTGFEAINGTGNDLDNVLTGNSGANVLNGGAGSDTLIGGLGNDTYVVDVATDVISETSALMNEIDSVRSTVSWTLGANLENLDLTGSEAINGTGNDLDNALTGNSGANVLNGGVGSDTLVGGLGNDTYVVDVATDVISETSTLSNEIDSVQSALSWALGANLENLVLTGSEPINGTGNELDNTLVGNSGANVLNGGVGHDILEGGLGQDSTVYVGNLGDYRFGWRNGYLTVTDLNAADGDEGTDYLRDIEVLQFADRTLNVSPCGETRINSTTVGHQSSSAVTALADGGWLVTWQSFDSSSFSRDIYTQRYDGSGSAVGGEVRSNSTTLNSQSASTVTALADGGWLVTWQSDYQDGSDSGIYAQRYDASGSVVGGEVRVNSTTLFDQSAPGVTALADGGWLVTWQSGYQDGSGSGIYAQRFGANGSAEGGEVRINSTTLNDQSAPAVIALADGGWWVTWSGNGAGDSAGIYAQRYNASGSAVGSETRINSTVVSDQSGSAVTALADGGWLVTWSSDQQAGSGYDIYAQRYNANGSVVGGETRINSTTADWQLAPGVTALADGGWLVTWQSLDSSSITWDIYSQRYGADGSPVGSETRINSTTVGNQSSSAVTALADGGWLVTWQADYQDGSGSDIYAQRYNADGSPVRMEISGTSAGDSLSGADGVTLVGGAGNDTYNVSGSLVGIREASAEGTDSVYSSADFTLAANLENLTLTGIAAINGTGNGLANILTGNDEANVLNGGAGSDTLIGGLGNDTYVVDVAADVISETSALPNEIDSVQSALSWTLGANLENLVLTGSAASTGTGNDLNNALVGNSAANVLSGGAGRDSLEGGLGQDTAVYAGNLSDYRFGLSNGYLTVTDLNVANGDEGTDYLRDIEVLQFADRTLHVNPGGETRINSTVAGDQSFSAVTALADGGWLVTWQSISQDGSGSGIYAQRYNASGSVVGGETQINSTTASDQSAPAVTALADGGWLVSWQSNYDWNVYAQRYSASGSAVGGETLINTTTAYEQSAPAVTALADGGWLVSWQSYSYSETSSGMDVYTQRYNASGSTVGGETRINSFTAYDQSAPAVTALADGGWLVTWTSSGQDGSGYGIYAQRYSASGSAVGGETRINSTTANDQYSPAITALADGGWLVTWQSFSEITYDTNVYAQRYNASGSAVGGEVRINSTTLNNQSASTVTALADGGWLVTWESDYQDGSDSGIYAQRYNASGSVVGGEIRINTTTADAQSSPAITALADGGWLVTWQSHNQITYDTDIYAQRYSANGKPVWTEIQGSNASDSLSGVGLVTLAGGAGNDTYTVSGSQVGIREASAEGTDTVQASAHFVLSANVENLILTGTAALNGTGNGLANILTGNSGVNVLNGGAGSDTLIGGLGNDTYVVDVATDVISETSTLATEIDTVQSTVGWTLGANLEKLVLTGSTAINGAGNALANTLTGNSGVNVLNGGAGSDTLIGGLGNDTYVVDVATDVISETSTLATEIDTVQSTVGWTLGANLEKLVLTGSTAINGAGNALANTLTGNSGANVLNGGAGSDTLIGGLGNDTYVVDVATDVISETSTLATEIDTVQSTVSWTLGANLEKLVLTGSSAINGAGNALANTLAGNSGANVLNGGAGSDTLIGGLGNDTYVVDVVTDVISETSTLATEIDTVQSTVSWTLGANLEKLVLTGSSAINGAGNALANTLTGNSGANVLNGGAGSDTLIGGLGNDTYVVDVATDVISETSTLATEIDTVQSTVGWTLGANLEKLVLTGSTAINGAGNALANTLTGNGAVNVLNGGAGSDTLIGGLGNDTYVVDVATDVISETSTLATEIDTVQSYVSWVLGSNLERLTLVGTAAINATGNALANVLVGNSAANVLNGGAGSDTLTGGAGADRFILDSSASSDLLTDFLSGTDKLVLDNSSLGGLGDKDAVLEGALLRSAAGGFASSAELVVFSSNISGAITAASAATQIGNAASAYAVGDTRIFAVDNGTQTGVYLFKAVDADAAVESNELHLLGMLNSAQTGVADYAFQS